MIILALPFLIILAIVVSFVSLSIARDRRYARRQYLTWLDKREACRQQVADVVSIAGWRTFRQRREQGEAT